MQCDFSNIFNWKYIFFFLLCMIFRLCDGVMIGHCYQARMGYVSYYYLIMCCIFLKTDVFQFLKHYYKTFYNILQTSHNNSIYYIVTMRLVVF